MLGQTLIRHDSRNFIEEPSKNVIELLGRSDIVFTNLEVAICPDTINCNPTRIDKDTPSAVVEPIVLDYLKSININLLSLSNNHSWDFGDYGIINTINEVKKRNINHAGTGENIEAASAASIMNVKGYKAALIAMSSASKFKNLAAAGDNKPGVNICDMSNEFDKKRILDTINKIKDTTDIIIAYQHLQGLGTLEQQEEWARQLIDNGVKIFVSHGDPRLYGIEKYNDGIIFYGLGNFVFQTRYELGHYDKEVWQSVIANIDFSNGKIKKVELIPIELEEGKPGSLFLETRGVPEIADEKPGLEILSRIFQMSDKYGTKMKIKNNRAYILLE
jgi:poly-gamma-glutamate synthesis protein (capsule biosynthesis protein)